MSKWAFKDGFPNFSLRNDEQRGHNWLGGSWALDSKLDYDILDLDVQKDTHWLYNK